MQKAGFAFLYAVLIVGIIGGLEWVIRGRDASRFATVAVGPSPVAVEQARHRALEQSILAKHPAALAELKSLESAVTKLRRDFKQIVGLEWESADAQQIERPRALNLALLRHDSAREAWTDLFAARIASTELDSRRQAVEAIGRAAAAGTFRAEDEATLEQIIDWGQGRGKVLKAQFRNLEHIKVMVAAEEFELAASKDERSTP